MIIVISASWLGFQRLHFETDILKILPGDLGSVKALEIIRDNYSRDQQVILVLESTEDEIYEEDVADLCAHLQLLLPETEIENSSNLESQTITYALALSELWTEADPADAKQMADLLLDAEKLQKHLDDVKEHIQTSFDQGSATIASYDPLGFLNHPGMQQLLDSNFSYQSENGLLHLVLIRFADFNPDYRKNKEIDARIRSAIDSWPGLKDFGLTYSLTGGPIYSAEVGSAMEQDMGGTIAITGLLIAILFLITQRHPGQLLVFTLLLLLTFFITLGAAGWVYSSLSLLSIGFAAILLGLVIDYAVVIARDAAESGLSGPALRKEIAPSILWATFTTVLVFGLLTFSSFDGVKQLGGLVVIGLITGAAVMLGFTPYFVRKFPSKPPRQLLRPPFPRRRVSRRLIITCFTIPIIIFIWKGPPGVSFDLSMVQPDGSLAEKTFAKVRQEFPAWSKRNLTLLARGDSPAALSRTVSELEQRLNELEKTNLVVSHVFPSKLIPNPGNRSQNLALWKEVSHQKERIISALKEAGFSDKGIALDKGVLDHILDPPLKKNLLRTPVIAQDESQNYYFSGKFLLSEPLSEASMETLSTLNGPNMTISGWPVLQTVLLSSAKQDLLFLFLPASLVLLCALLIVFRRWRDTFISIGVLIVVLFVTNAIVVLGGMNWNFLSGMAIPLIVGTGIDYSIHIIYALRRHRGDRQKVWNSVGKAICFCGLSTAIGFGSLIFASNALLQSMGCLCAIGVLLTSTLSVLIIPSLWKDRCGQRAV